ncbi:hypothetical protein HYS00_05250, partial [Candidatus Microgenomates bacterium]|nr:hypothetical protein [Candidatus Microgenomates bacterium]
PVDPNAPVTPGADAMAIPAAAPDPLAAQQPAQMSPAVAPVNTMPPQSPQDIPGNGMVMPEFPQTPPSAPSLPPTNGQGNTMQFGGGQLSVN